MWPVALFLCCFVLCGCTTTPSAADRGDLAAATVDAAIADFAFAQPDLNDPWWSSDGPPPEDAGSPPPSQSCVPDAAARDMASTCDLPPSTCLDSRWLIYYVNPVCQGGSCRWEKRFLDCFTMPANACSGNGCVYAGTA